MPDKIRRTEVLKALDVKSNPDGSQVVYSIVFLKKNGHVYPVNHDLIN